jgi:hypothetical protein
MAKRNFVVPLFDYERIFRLICGALDSRANTPHACVFFSIVGAALLEKHYKVPAMPIVGAAAYNVGISGNACNVSTFGKMTDGILTSSSDAFHCWIEAKGTIIDFTAPLFQESMRNYGHDVVVPPKMFQKPKAEMSQSPLALQNEGDFYLNPNPELAQEIYQRFFNKAAAGDLANVVLHYYCRPPKPLPKNMGMRDDLGNTYMINLRGPRIMGVW